VARNVVGKARGAHFASRKLFQLVRVVQRHMVLFLLLHTDMGTAVSISLHPMAQRSEIGSARCAHLHGLYLRRHVVAALERYLENSHKSVPMYIYYIERTFENIHTVTRDTLPPSSYSNTCGRGVKDESEPASCTLTNC
jgi:hypothetical protein